MKNPNSKLEMYSLLRILHNNQIFYERIYLLFFNYPDINSSSLIDIKNEILEILLHFSCV